MARYAQGYERKNSDTKNIIIMISVIVGVIILSLGIAVLVKALKKDEPTRSFASEEYSEFFVDYAKANVDVNKNGQEDDNYYIYFCDPDSESDSNMDLVLDYIDAYKKGEDSNMIPLYLINTNSSITDANKQSVEDSIYVSTDKIASGKLVFVHNANNESYEEGTQYPSRWIMSNSDTIKTVLSLETKVYLSHWISE